MTAPPTAKDVLLRLDEESLKKDPTDVFQLLEKLGEGSYGSVHKGLHKATGQIIAIKQVPVDDSELQEIIKEISIMQQCDSPNVVRYYGSYFKSSDLWIVMEFCAAGSVADIMRLRKQTMKEQEIATILKYTLKGLEHIHSRRKIHRDIKAGNILLNEKGEAKLADFGVAGQLSDTMAKRNTVIGTPFWMAPEVIQEIGYDTVADIWSLGITTIEMAEGKPPYADIHPMRAIFMIPTNPSPVLREKNPDWSNDIKEFVAQCLQRDPEKRPSATALLHHPFIAKAKEPAISLHEIVDEAMTIMATVGNDPPSGSEDEQEQGEVQTIVPTTLQVNENTMINHAESTQEDSEEEVLESGTMVVNDIPTQENGDNEEDDESTMKRSDNKPVENYKPAFMQHFEQLDEEKQKGVAAAKRLSKATELKAMNVEDLRTRLASLDPEMETEIQELKKRYEAKRAPILAAIAAKQKNT
eukprot:m.180385 g.180385  ORF g.180385 m.180385 type:complete len:469 (-) comp25418_c0_seq3:995-2401(-)